MNCLALKIELLIIVYALISELIMLTMLGITTEIFSDVLLGVTTIVAVSMIVESNVEVLPLTLRM